MLGALTSVGEMSFRLEGDHMSDQQRLGFPNSGHSRDALVDPAVYDAARKLAIRFSDDSDVPARFRTGRVAQERRRKASLDTQIEDRFRDRIRIWTSIVLDINQRLDSGLGQRFINSAPTLDGARSVTACPDFQRLLDYLILRRDIEGCSGDELGYLSALFTAFQASIEDDLSSQEPSA